MGIPRNMTYGNDLRRQFPILDYAFNCFGRRGISLVGDVIIVYRTSDYVKDVSDGIMYVILLRM
jgi:hypothetical protein